MPPLPEPVAHMYPTDLEKFQESETFAHAFSVAVGRPGETSEPLHASYQMLSYGRLVAQECAGICRDMACGGSAFNSAAAAIEAEIRKRFNLETK